MLKSLKKVLAVDLFFPQPEHHQLFLRSKCRDFKTLSSFVEIIKCFVLFLCDIFGSKFIKIMHQSTVNNLLLPFDMISPKISSRIISKECLSSRFDIFRSYFGIFL